MGRRVLRRHIWGCSVCLCPIKKDARLICIMDLISFPYVVNENFYQTGRIVRRKAQIVDIFYAAAQLSNQGYIDASAGGV